MQRALLSVWLGVVVFNVGTGHEQSLPAAKQKQALLEQERLRREHATQNEQAQHGMCRLTIELVSKETQKTLAGNVRLVDQSAQQPLDLKGLISRPESWYSIDGTATVDVPRTRIQVSAFHGVESLMATQEIDVRERGAATIRISVGRFYDLGKQHLVSGNTHLHLNRLSRSESDRYLRTVPAADGIDLLYVSHLIRAIEDETYITNEYDWKSLADLSNDDVTLRFGEEHRHNLGPHAEGFGHVMLLDIPRLIQPVSIGPGLTQAGSDGLPLNRGIREAHRVDGTVVWCHNSFGMEDVPNWMTGMLHAQNIHDGGPHGQYEDTFYRYMNLGLRVPFSTGTDWFIYDLSRVFIPLEGQVTSEAWLAALQRGQSFITNGPLLELKIGQQVIGDTLELVKGDVVEIAAKGVGRRDFRRIELVHNGNVVDDVDSQLGRSGVYEAALEFRLELAEPGWVALRVPWENNRNLFGEKIFAHTSAIYLDVDGQQRFDRKVAHELIVEMERNLGIIQRMAQFDSAEEEQRVLKVHREGILALQERMLGASREENDQ